MARVGYLVGPLVHGMLAISIVIAHSSLANCQDDDEELSPGLLADYQSGEIGIQRVDGDIAFDWSDGGSPDVRLPDGPFRVRWSGQILLRAEGTYRWHAYLQGRLSVRINGSTVLTGRTEQAQWISGDEIALSFGEFPIEVEFESAGPSRVMLCWSSDQFPLEPLPQHVLFHQRNEALARVAANPVDHLARSSLRSVSWPIEWSEIGPRTLAAAGWPGDFARLAGAADSTRRRTARPDAKVRILA
ncbi:MAG: hypothetical protein U0872_13835 [Planctomycetaceae bacterium]